MVAVIVQVAPLAHGAQVRAVAGLAAVFRRVIKVRGGQNDPRAGVGHRAVTIRTSSYVRRSFAFAQAFALPPGSLFDLACNRRPVVGVAGLVFGSNRHGSLAQHVSAVPLDP